MISKQYLLECNLPDHPCYSIATGDAADRSIRRSISTEYRTEIGAIIPPTVLRQTATKTSKKSPHRQKIVYYLRIFVRVLGFPHLFDKLISFCMLIISVHTIYWRIQFSMLEASTFIFLYFSDVKCMKRSLIWKKRGRCYNEKSY